MEVLKVIDTKISESELQDAFNKNLECLEEGLKYLDSYVNIGVGQIDSLALDINGNLVVIEYKTAENSDRDALIQALSYYAWLNENKAWLKEYLRKKGISEVRDIRIIIVAPNFDNKVIKAAQAVKPHTILVRYMVCEYNSKRGIVPQVILDNTMRQLPPEPPRTLDDHFKDREHLKPLFEELKGKIEENIENFNIRVTKDYIGFALHNRLFCLVFVQKQGLRVALPLKGEIESDRFGGWPADERWGYLKVTSDEEIDEELLEWIKLAYRKVMEG
ncbi:MAG TPA: DUF91 domain-containing protein [Thermococcus sp.]|nr:DUF91 domain-containing protein [Thermococcus sp.]